MKLPSAAEPNMRARRGWGILRRQVAGYLFVAPAILFLLSVTAYPILNALWMSVTKYSIANPVHPFVGLANYAKLLSDSLLLNSLRNSFVLGLFGSGIAFTTGLAMAMLVNVDWAPVRVRESIRGPLIMPWIISTTLAALMWGLMLHRSGIINSYLIRLGLVEEPIIFIGGLEYSLPSIIGIFAWKAYPFALVMILSALKSVPTELYDAARVDGASGRQVLRYVTLPMVMPVLLTIALLMFIWGFGQYDLVRVMTSGGPVHASEVVSYYLYNVAFLQSRFSYGAAISMVVFGILLLFGIVYVRLYARSRPWG